MLLQCLTVETPLSARLVWNNRADLDIHILHPDGSCFVMYAFLNGVCKDPATNSFMEPRTPEQAGLLEYDCIRCNLPQQEYAIVPFPQNGEYIIAVDLFVADPALVNEVNGIFEYELFITKDGVETSYKGFIDVYNTPEVWDGSLYRCGWCRANFYRVTYP